MCIIVQYCTISGPLPEATPTESDRRIWSNLVGFGRIQSDLVGFGRIQSDLVGFGRIRSELAGLGWISISGKFGRNWSESVGIGRNLSELDEIGRNWSESVGFGQIWSDLVGVASGRGPNIKVKNVVGGASRGLVICLFLEFSDNIVIIA